MAQQAAKKKTKGEKNPDRRNGKAWKKHSVKAKVKTEARKIKDEIILAQREGRRIKNQILRKAETAAQIEIDEHVKEMKRNGGVAA